MIRGVTGVHDLLHGHQSRCVHLQISCAGRWRWSYGWHYGFAAAGFGMLLGLGVYLAGQRYLRPRITGRAVAGGRAGKVARLVRRGEARWWRWWALCALLNVVFWAVYEQQGNTMQSWADERTVWPVFSSASRFRPPGFSPSIPLMIFAFTPFVVDVIWTRQAKRGTEPSTVDQDGARLLRRHRGLNLVMALAALHADGGKASWLWLFGYFVRSSDHRRALSLAGRPVARHQGRSRPHPVDDDGRLAGDEFCRQFPCRLYRQLLEPNRQAGVLHGRRGHCRDRRRGDLRLSLAAARHAAGMTPKLASRGSPRPRRWARSDVFRAARAPARPRNFTA